MIKLYNKDIVQIYVDAINFSNIFRIIFFVTLFLYSIMSLLQLINFGSHSGLADLIEFLLIFPTIYIVIVGLSKHFLAINNDKRLSPILLNPFLSIKCACNAIKPSEDDKINYKFINTFYHLSIFSIIITVITYIVFFSYLLYRRY